MSDVIENPDIYKAGGIIIKDRKVLVEHSRGKTTFNTPGGKLEPGETERQALVRELKEEFDIDVQEDDLEYFDTFYGRAAGQEHKTIKMAVYRVKKWQGEIKPTSEVEELLWINSEVPTDVEVAPLFVQNVVPRLAAEGLID